MVINVQSVKAVAVAILFVLSENKAISHKISSA
jgi:hypothetical protein